MHLWMHFGRWKRAQSHPQVLVPLPSSLSRTFSQTLTPVLKLLTPGQDLRRRLLICLLEVSFYYYPSLMATTFSLYSCFTMDPAPSSKTLFSSAQVSSCMTAVQSDDQFIDTMCIPFGWKVCMSHCEEDRRMWCMLNVNSDHFMLSSTFS